MRIGATDYKDTDPFNYFLYASDYATLIRATDFSLCIGTYSTMLDNDHPSFSPPEENCTLWRYMDLAKLLSLLEKKSLFFPRADKFEDQFEGELTKAEVALRRHSEQEGVQPTGHVENLIKLSEMFRRSMYLNCWFTSEHESAAMWKSYINSPEGIAIRTDHDALSHILERSPITVRTSMVSYIDYDKKVFPDSNMFSRFLHKRLSFEHENELRAIIWSLEEANQTLIEGNAPSVSLDIEPQELIKSVHVSPKAPDWYGELIEQIIRRYGLTCDVERSRLYDRPSFV